MLGLARDYLGMTQAGLAARLSFTQTTLSRYEAGILDVPDDHLVEIAQVLNRPLSFFFRDDRVYATSGFYHRKRTKLSAKDRKRVHAQVNDLRIQANMLLHEAQIESAYRFHQLGSAVCGSPERSARQLRQLWQLPPGPIRNVVSAIESAGGIVFSCEFGTDRIDGISQWTLDNPTSPPVLFVNEAMPTDRQRFTLSHEIGHISMHYVKPDGDGEDEADRFASEFLMPADEIKPELRRITLEKAAALKSYWKVSIASLIRRARDLETITDRQYRQFCMLLSKFGYRKVEPVPLPRERPRLFDEIIEAHRQYHHHDDAELAERLGMFEADFQSRFGHGLNGLRLVV